MRFRFDTARLILRNMTPDDWQAAFRWCGGPDVAKYMIYTVYTRAEDVKTQWLDNLNLDDPDRYDAGIVLKETGELIGSAGMYYKPEEDLWTIGYNLRKDQWGHGYTGEAIRGLTDHIRKTRRIRGILGEFANENQKSRRVMEKLGMTYAGETEYTKLDGSEVFPAKLYRRIFE